MQENYSKYAKAERVTTNPLLDEPAILFLGRTLWELLLAAGVFVAMSLFVDAPLQGLIVGAAVGWAVPWYRTHCTRGFAAHLAWMLGIHTPKTLPCGRIFSLSKSVVHLGP